MKLSINIHKLYVKYILIISIDIDIEFIGTLEQYMVISENFI